MLILTINEILQSKYNAMLPLKCDYCDKIFYRTQKQVKLGLKLCTVKHFCSRKCHASGRTSDLIQVSCGACHKTITILESDLRRKLKVNDNKNTIYCSKNCANKLNTFRSPATKNKISKTLKRKYQQGLIVHPNAIHNQPPKICKICGIEFRHRRNKATCSKKCYQTLCISIGSLGGLKTASSPFQKRNRSSNEKLFFERISKQYPDALSNKRMFNGWDADIIIPSLKLAIHWNGIWHYKVVLSPELLMKVQNKDVLRYKAIEECGYQNYIIQDLGSKNLSKVEEEFNKFIFFVRQTIMST